MWCQRLLSVACLCFLLIFSGVNFLASSQVGEYTALFRQKGKQCITAFDRLCEYSDYYTLQHIAGLFIVVLNKHVPGVWSGEFVQKTSDGEIHDPDILKDVEGLYKEFKVVEQSRLELISRTFLKILQNHIPGFDPGIFKTPVTPGCDEDVELELSGSKSTTPESQSADKSDVKLGDSILQRQLQDLDDGEKKLLLGNNDCKWFATINEGEGENTKKPSVHTFCIKIDLSCFGRKK